MDENLKQFYSYRKIKLEDGDYLNISISFPIPETPITKNKETDSKYFKCYVAESLEMSKAFDNKKDVEFRINNFINSNNLAKLFFPTFLYSLVIIYKKFTRNKIKAENTPKENLIPRLKGFGIALLFYASVNIFYRYLSKTSNEGRIEYLKELLEGDKELSLEEYEKYKSLYSDEVNRNEKI